ncbi:MAG TPA: sigma 54 modulation/S30EA ribosomal C-terminal domain-containing protein, partial [Candidatus Acidoferrum sp.]|nr:sigma 54 modulation/S30EA ribosomal C-terminal domain-containing protein [Candidatus Acidoferrum sp.]
RTLRGSSAAPSFQAGLDDLLDKMERRAVDYKSKPRLRARPTEEKALLRRLADGTAEAGHERRIVKSKRFGIEPMFEEDAVREMEELGHSFFIFVDAATERLAVLYRRNDGDYGLIEPMVGGEYARGQADGRTGGKAVRSLRRAGRGREATANDSGDVRAQARR